MQLTPVFVSISDPRSARHARHDLAELLTVAVCAVLSGVDDFVDIELWGEAKIDWLRGFMKVEHGIPTDGTIGRAFAMIGPDDLESAFRRWVGMVVPALVGDTAVAIDAKTSRRSGGKNKADASPLHLVSAFAAGMRSWPNGDRREVERDVTRLERWSSSCRGRGRRGWRSNRRRAR